MFTINTTTDEVIEVKCEICGATDGVELTTDGRLLCPDHLQSEGYDCCDRCGAWGRSDDMWHISDVDELWCESCYDRYAFYCDCCGEFVAVETTRVQGGDYVCEDCLEEYYTVCYICGAIVRNCDAMWSDRLDAYLCPRCYDDENADDGHFSCTIDRCNDADDGSLIHRYSYKPRADIRRRSNEAENALTIGVELEIDAPYRDGIYEARERAAGKIKNLTDRVYLKNDGSLNNGFEIITHPGTLAHHMYEMPWSGICKAAVKEEFLSHDARTCGLHVHVGREQLGDNADERNTVIRKITVLMVRFWDELVRFSRRTNGQLSDWAAPCNVPGYRYDMSASDLQLILPRVRVANDHDNRYYAINCENEATIEFRLFRGTLKRDTIIATLQLVSNLCQYAMAHDLDDIQHSRFTDIVGFRHWTELDAYCAVRGITHEAPDTDAATTKRTPNFLGYGASDVANS